MRFDLVWRRQLPSAGRQAGRQQLLFRATVAILRVGGSPPIGLIEFPVELQLQFRLRHQLCLRLRHFSNCSRDRRWRGKGRWKEPIWLSTNFIWELALPHIVGRTFSFIFSAFELSFSLLSLSRLFFGKERIMWWSIRHVGRCDYLWLCFEIKRKPKIPQGSPAVAIKKTLLTCIVLGSI